MHWGDGELEELISYNELSNLISEQQQAHLDGQQELMGFHKISDHQGPLKSQDPLYKGSLWNVAIHWDDSMVTWEPLNEIAKFDPVTVAFYGQQHDLLSLPHGAFLSIPMFHPHPTYECFLPYFETSNLL